MKHLYIVTFWQYYAGSNDESTQILPAEIFTSKTAANELGNRFGKKIEYFRNREARRYHKAMELFERNWERENPKPREVQKPAAPSRRNFQFLDDAAWANIQLQYNEALGRYREAKRAYDIETANWNERLENAVRTDFMVANPPTVELTDWELENLNEDCYWELDTITLTDERAAEIARALSE